MRRLLLLPVVGLAATVEELYRRGYVWPIATTIIRPLMPRAETEPDPIG